MTPLSMEICTLYTLYALYTIAKMQDHLLVLFMRWALSGGGGGGGAALKLEARKN